MNDLLGKYAIFVVPSYVLTCVTFLALAIVTTRRMLHWQKLADEQAKKLEKEKAMKPKLALWAAAPLALFALLLGVFGVMLARGGGERGFSKTGMTGAASPGYDLASLDGGKSLTPASFAGRPYLVNFFASWCVPCRQEAPALSALAKQGVPILGIAYKDAPAKTKQMLDQLGDPYAQVALDPNGRTGIEFGVTGVPETYVIGADGKIVALYRLPLDAAAISSVIQPALKRAAR